MIKKTLVLSVAFVLGVFILYGFQHSGEKPSTDKQELQKISKTDAYTDYTAFNLKCGGGKCGGGKCGGGKCGGGKCGKAKAKAKGGKAMMFMSKDANGDGKVSLKEFQDEALAEFPEKDKNKDGKITREECGMFDDFNTDGNDFLSKEEFINGHKALFEKLDVNHDGFVVPSEAKQMQSIMKCGGGKCGDGGKHRRSMKPHKVKIKEVKTKMKKSMKCGEGKCGK